MGGHGRRRLDYPAAARPPAPTTAAGRVSRPGPRGSGGASSSDDHEFGTWGTRFLQMPRDPTQDQPMAPFGLTLAPPHLHPNTPRPRAPELSRPGSVRSVSCSRLLPDWN